MFRQQKMMKKRFVIYFCATAYFLTGVDAKICERIEAVTSMVEVTFSTAYIATYQGQCYYGCIKTRLATSVNRRYVPKREWKTIKSCCSGYMRTDDSSNDSDIVCEPICMPACKNGHCRAPAECACDTGYIPDPKNSHNCLPSCEEGCDHGACVAPDTCQCDFGYKHVLVNNTCLPVCTEPCHNGTCVAPETCECLSGFRKSEKNLCEPYCSNGCDNGFCTAPETCRCNSGWHIQESQDVPNKHCEPICSKPCDNGTCVAPETCECKAWYRKSKSGICEPECTSPCGNGTCIAPQKCSCFPGYHINSTNTVFSLFSLLSDHHAPVCIPTCALCKDEDCAAPNKCLLRTTRQLPDMRDDYDTLDDELFYDDYFPDHFFNSYFETNKRVTSKSAHSDDTKTETNKSPFHRSTRPDDTNTDIMGSYGTSPTDDVNTKSMKNYFDLNTRSHDTSTKSVNYPFDKSTLSYDTTTVTGTVKNPSSTSTHSDDTINTESRKSMSWLQQHWVSIFIPVLVIVMAAVIMLLVWRWTPIIIFFKGRSYVVEGDPVDSNGPRPFEDIQISAINEKEKTAQK